MFNQQKKKRNRLREGKGKSGIERQRKGERSFDVRLVWLRWESHLCCSGVLCPDLKRADSDSSLEPWEAYFLIKERYLLETMTVGLFHCLPCQFIQMNPAFMQASQENSQGFTHFHFFLSNTGKPDKLICQVVENVSLHSRYNIYLAEYPFQSYFLWNPIQCLILFMVIIFQ